MKSPVTSLSDLKQMRGGDLLRGYFFQNLRRIGHFLVFWFFLQKIP